MGGAGAEQSAKGQQSCNAPLERACLGSMPRDQRNVYQRSKDDTELMLWGKQHALTATKLAELSPQPVSLLSTPDLPLDVAIKLLRAYHVCGATIAEQITAMPILGQG